MLQTAKKKDGTLLSLKSKTGSNNFQTPPWPVELLIDYCLTDLVSLENFTDDPIIFDPCCGKGQLVSTLCTKGYSSYGMDLETGYNFLTDPLPADVDMIITNPPYSLKDQFIARCYEHGKPFALLMPLTALEGKKRQPLYKENGLQLALLPRRVNFVPPSGKGSGAYFPVGWFCHDFKFRKDIVYL